MAPLSYRNGVDEAPPPFAPSVLALVAKRFVGGSRTTSRHTQPPPVWMLWEAHSLHRPCS